MLFRSNDCFDNVMPPGILTRICEGHRADEVPFEFTVGQRVLPAGIYSITEVSSNMIEIENREKGTTLYFSTYPSDRVKGKPNMLVFSKHGDQYFLHEVRGGSGQYAEDLSPSKLEKEIQRQETARANQQSVDIALNKK